MNQSARRTRVRSRTLGALEVRRDRTGTRLMAHGVLYSIRPVTPSETPAPWLVLAAAPWMLERPRGRRTRPLRIGLLGYGGGTVARLIRRFDATAEIIGAEPDAEVRKLAAKEMGAGRLGATIVPTDAVRLLSRPEVRFDVLIDDVFAPTRGRLARPPGVSDVPDLARLRLRAGGLYAVNLVSPGGPEERTTVARIRAGFENVLVVYMREYAHKIVIASNQAFRRGALRAALRRILFNPGASLVDLGIGTVRRHGG